MAPLFLVPPTTRARVLNVVESPLLALSSTGLSFLPSPIVVTRQWPSVRSLLFAPSIASGTPSLARFEVFPLFCFHRAGRQSLLFILGARRFLSPSPPLFSMACQSVMTWYSHSPTFSPTLGYFHFESSSSCPTATARRWSRQPLCSIILGVGVSSFLSWETSSPPPWGNLLTLTKGGVSSSWGRLKLLF